MEEWDLSAVDEDGPGDGLGDGLGGGAPPAPRGALGLLAALAGLLLVVGFVVWHPHEPETPKPATPIALGANLLAPVRLRIPHGATTTANAGYVGLQFSTYGSMLVTVPDEVEQPGGVRVALPADPVAWLEQHPDVFVSRVRTVTVAGQPVTQLDYRRSRTAQPQSPFARLALFCTADCTRITSNARVRATFVPVDGKLVLVEAVWRTDGTLVGRQMPPALGKAYTQLLTSLTPRLPSTS